MVKEFENEFGKTFCKVDYMSDYSLVLVAWYGYTTRLQVETVMLWIEEQMQQAPCNTIINDCSEILSVWGDSIGWLSRIWAYKMTRMGLKNLVHVAKLNSFGYKIGTQLQTTLIDQVEFKSFGTRVEAINWIETDKSPDHT